MDISVLELLQEVTSPSCSSPAGYPAFQEHGRRNWQERELAREIEQLIGLADSADLEENCLLN